MELLSQLWALGIAAETMPRANPSLTEQYAFAQVGLCDGGGLLAYKNSYEKGLSPLGAG
jgi:hypothetical protein